jgi:hypothetical protein
MQPKEVKDRHALIIAGVFTGIVASVWAFTQLQFDGTTERTVATESAPPFSNLISGIKEQWANATEALPETPLADEEDLAEVRADQLQLSEDTLTEIRESETATTASWVEAGTPATTSTMGREVQIVTVSATNNASMTAATTTATSE